MTAQALGTGQTVIVASLNSSHGSQEPARGHFRSVGPSTAPPGEGCPFATLPFMHEAWGGGICLAL